jgi:hypothetical protein
MESRQGKSVRHRWREALLGGLAGLGVPVLLRGLRRGRRPSTSPATVGVLAGLLGALVGGGVARRPQGRPEPGEAGGVSTEKARDLKPAPRQGDSLEPRRGPSGRERY